MESSRDLLAFIDASPTPYHAVAEVSRRLAERGFRECSESELWSLSPGDRRFVVRNGGSLLAFQVGSESPVEGGFRIVGAHTDSPNLRAKPRADVAAHGYRQLAVEPYGGLLLHTWLDRDLSLAGRVTMREREGARTLLVDFGRPLVRIPSLAIHLNRELRESGLKLNPETQAIPVLGLEGTPSLAVLVATELRAQQLADVAPDAILAHDLMLYDSQPSAALGADGAFLAAPRLDNLASCHAATSALLGASGAGLPRHTGAIVLYDHEEVGSQSAQGAAGTFLLESLERVVGAFKGGAPQGFARARSRSLLISADMAHAVHPNFAEKHDAGHRPVLGRGPVIKTNVNQSYASDAKTAGMFAELCAELGIVPQQFSARNDGPCGSTIGPISAARTGIPAVDVGNPMLSMHSCREMAGAADVAPMIRVLERFFTANA
ncbi:MAG TPA: M18 family aminopeptidase [Myxococcota bacterium]|nr:M18 family aminopeptidase [Myxococcota bacterium]